MIELTPDECRVLGVLIEKALTTPDGYPLTLNALVNGASQKNNRAPVEDYDEDRIRDAVAGLRASGLVIQTDAAGSRASKYKHVAAEKLGLNSREIAVMAELLLRGPQTIGEIRGRASRMHPLDTLDVVTSTLQQLMGRPEPLVRQLPPAAGSRAERYAQLLCPDAHPLDAPPAESAATGRNPTGIGQRVTELEAKVERLTMALRKLAKAVGEPDPLWEEGRS